VRRAAVAIVPSGSRWGIPGLFTLVRVGASRAGFVGAATTGAPYVRAWLGERDLEVREWAVEGDTVTLLLAGPVAPADAGALAADFAKAYAELVTFDVEHVPSVRD